jgi:anti-sigma regulatory factor (Ser/Thr protein kinase)
MTQSIRIPVEDATQCAEARRNALRLAHEIAFDEVRAGQVGIVVTEACTNILKHAKCGEILLHTTDPGGADAAPELEMLALDKGPGMRDLDQCLADGFSTGGAVHGGLGQGLGAIQRLADESDFYSVPGEGTVILARWVNAKPAQNSNGHHPRLRIGAVNVSKYGEEFCGDSWGIEQFDCVSTLLVADGLGHGYDASLASLEAVRILRNNRDLSPGLLLDLTHKALRSLRGAAVSVARLELEAGRLTFSGLGNVTAQIYLGSQRSQHLVSVNGTAGHQAARIREFAYPWPPGGILIMHSDGLASSASIEARPDLALHDPALIAAVLYRDFARGHDDATVVVAKAA